MLTENIEISDIFTDLELCNKDKLNDRLKKVKYADVILFSNQDLAEELFEGLV